MLFTINIPAQDDENFLPDSFDKNIGKKVVIGNSHGKIIEAEVAEDGKSAKVTFEFPQEVVGRDLEILNHLALRGMRGSN